MVCHVYDIFWKSTFTPQNFEEMYLPHFWPVLNDLNDPNVGGKMSFIFSFKFAFTIGVATAITMQQFFCIMCNKCTTSAFETQV